MTLPTAETGLYEQPPYTLHHEDSSHPLILVCEHASRYIPPALNALGRALRYVLEHRVFINGLRTVVLR